MWSWSGCDNGFPSTSDGAIIARRTPAVASSWSWPNSHSGSRSVRCATGCSRPPPSSTTVAAQRFHAPMFAVSAGSDSDRRRSHNSP